MERDVQQRGIDHRNRQIPVSPRDQCRKPQRQHDQVEPPEHRFECGIEQRAAACAHRLEVHPGSQPQPRIADRPVDQRLAGFLAHPGQRDVFDEAIIMRVPAALHQRPLGRTAKGVGRIGGVLRIVTRKAPGPVMLPCADPQVIAHPPFAHGKMAERRLVVQAPRQDHGIGRHRHQHELLPPPHEPTDRQREKRQQQHRVAGEDRAAKAQPGEQRAVCIEQQPAGAEQEDQQAFGKHRIVKGDKERAGGDQQRLGQAAGQAQCDQREGGGQQRLGNEDRRGALRQQREEDRIERRAHHIVDVAGLGKMRAGGEVIEAVAARRWHHDHQHHQPRDQRYHNDLADTAHAFVSCT